MRIIYEIKNIKEFKNLSLMSKVGFCILQLGMISFVFYWLLEILNINTFLSNRFLFYSIGLCFFGSVFTITYDKKRKDKTKIKPMGPI
jgi:hypothetical protein